MGQMDHQLGFADESAYATAATVTRFFEYESEGIEDAYGRTESDPLRTGSGFVRADRNTPYFSGAAGTIQMSVLTKGFGYFLKHMMGAVATTGPSETVVYTHTGTEGDLYGDSFTCQVNRPFHPSGTSQAFTFAGGKVTEWTLSNSVDGNLLLDLGVDFASAATDVALASASYPASMDNFTWAGGLLTVGGSAFDVTEIGLSVNNGLDVDRRQIRANTQKKEPTSGRREGSFTIVADFDSLAQRNRAASDTRDGAQAELVAVWEGPNIITGATTLKPKLTVTVPVGRFDTWSAPSAGPEAISQSLGGVIRYNGTDSPLSIAVQSIDTTP